MYVPLTAVVDPLVNAELRRISLEFQLLSTKILKEYTVEPQKPKDLDVAVCDGILWNPLGDGIRRPLWFDVGIWKPFD